MNSRMRTRMMSLTLLVIAAMAMMSAASPARSAAIDVYVTQAPPAPPVELRAPARVGYVWAPGYYVYRPTGYEWVNGGYITARPGLQWVNDRWEEDRGRFRYVPGYWTR